MDPWEKLFEGQPEYFVDQALEHIHKIEVGEGEVLMEPGDEDASMIYVLSGKVAVVRGGITIDTSGLSADATALANRLAGSIDNLSEEDIRSMLELIEAAKNK